MKNKLPKNKEEYNKWWKDWDKKYHKANDAIQVLVRENINAQISAGFFEPGDLFDNSGTDGGEGTSGIDRLPYGTSGINRGD